MEGVVAIFIPIIAIVMVFSIPIVAIITEHLQKNKKAEIMQKAIEMGTPIDNLKLDEPKQRMPYRSGMVTTACGLGVLIFGFAISRIENDPEPMYVFIGMAAVVILIGLALLINDKMNYDRIFKDD
jgi:hypothetical protein